MTSVNREERFARFQQFFDEGRIIRGAWHKKDAEGREIACLLGAFGEDIHSSSDCPADVMPNWLAKITPNIDDMTSNLAWTEIIRRYASVAQKWHTLDASAWERVRCELLIAAVEIALPHDKSGSCNNVLLLLKRKQVGDDPTTEEWRKVHADADADADAADAAADADAAAAADADADAAYAAADAAAAAYVVDAYAAYAYAAYAAAYAAYAYAAYAAATYATYAAADAAADAYAAYAAADAAYAAADAYAAYAAADAAYAACAADDADAYAAYAAADAAYAAADAAAATAAAAYAAYAAAYAATKSKSWDKIANAVLFAIEREVAKQN